MEFCEICFHLKYDAMVNVCRGEGERYADKLICEVSHWILHILRARESTNLTEEDGGGKIKLIHTRTRCMRILLHWGDSVQGGRYECFEGLDEGHCR